MSIVRLRVTTVTEFLVERDRMDGDMLDAALDRRVRDFKPEWVGDLGALAEMQVPRVLDVEAEVW